MLFLYSGRTRFFPTFFTPTILYEFVDITSNNIIRWWLGWFDFVHPVMSIILTSRKSQGLMDLWEEYCLHNHYISWLIILIQAQEDLYIADSYTKNIYSFSNAPVCFWFAKGAACRKLWSLYPFLKWTDEYVMSCKKELTW